MALGYGRQPTKVTNTDHTVIIGGPANSSKMRMINRIKVQNGSTTALNVRLYVLVGSDQYDLYDLALAAGETLSEPGPDGLISGDFLKLVLSATPSGGRGQVSAWTTYADVEKIV